MFNMIGALVRLTERRVARPGWFQMKPEIRELAASDLEQLCMLAAQFASSFRLERSAFELAARELMADPSAHLEGAFLANRLVGYCLGFDHQTFFANGRVSWVEEIMVTEGSRQLGIGRLLMDHFEAWARLRGSKLVALATRRAADFYESLGYEKSATYYRRIL